ncbi:sensor histidine kinase [Streptomyces sp. NBC_01187]|uniref:sensor histidine kinase n=1 Tax=Streptomyces sp. NBC_01187 TaxID=2903766 RepID=UPI0038683289|nr:histidine kinase [Streptomyces sp. NBC_01187]
MGIGIRRGVVRRICRGGIHAATGALLSVPPLVVALTVTPPAWPPALRFPVFGLALCAVVGAMGVPRAARRGSVRLANRLLDAGLPAPAAPATHRSPAGRWVNRARTSAYLAAHMALGTTVTAVAALALFAAVLFPSVWLDGGGPVAVFGTTVRVPSGPPGLWTAAVCAGSLALGCAVAAGGAVAARSPARALLGHRAAERLAAVEKQRDLLARRNRLAQELHDSIGHTLTAATIQAAVAGELMDSDPVAARRALTSIEETSRAAMDDLDHVLGVLRARQSDTAPQRTLADLGPLTERVREAGTGLHVETSGDLDKVPAAVSREAYRIIQEGLTNALRHGTRSATGAEAGPGISLRVAARDGWLEVTLTNPVDAAAPFRPGRTARGNGLTGVAERVRLLRGELSAGADGEQGTRWRLAARIPLRSTP